ncbi:MAG TPA: helix-turn-helix domain-containing protein [Candidatus Saccharimonadia bacterium]|nr:helix-turn-helix domain-containing protein [Candidatus Saccharimonadia bacterium]
MTIPEHETKYIEMASDGTMNRWVGVFGRLTEEEQIAMKGLSKLPGTEIISNSHNDHEEIPHYEIGFQVIWSSIEPDLRAQQYAELVAEVLKESGAEVSLDRKIKDMGEIDGLFDSEFFRTLLEQMPDNIGTTSNGSRSKKVYERMSDENGDSNKIPSGLDETDSRLYFERNYGRNTVRSAHLLSVREAAPFLGISTATVMNRIHDGTIKHIVLPRRVGSRVVYRISATEMMKQLDGRPISRENMLQMLAER